MCAHCINYSQKTRNVSFVKSSSDFGSLLRIFSMFFSSNVSTRWMDIWGFGYFHVVVCHSSYRFQVKRMKTFGLAAKLGRRNPTRKLFFRESRQSAFGLSLVDWKEKVSVKSFGVFTSRVTQNIDTNVQNTAWLKI